MFDHLRASLALGSGDQFRESGKLRWLQFKRAETRFIGRPPSRASFHREAHGFVGLHARATKAARAARYETLRATKIAGCGRRRTRCGQARPWLQSPWQGGQFIARHQRLPRRLALALPSL
jgi:hypothetical protein